MRIGIDLMGSDTSPSAFFNAILQALPTIPEKISLVLIATHSVVKELSRTPQMPNIEFFPVSDVISMTDDPLSSMKRKESSISMGIKLLKKKHLDAFISAGNTGALITGATLQLQRLPGIRRPALLALLPTAAGNVAILDIGGSVSCRADHLVQFAQMGAVFQICYQKIQTPSVGLLNIGVEPQKGHSIVRQAYQRLASISNSPSLMHFVGNVEGRELFQGAVDVLVTDGFTGNVLLKTSEGVSSFILQHLNELLNQYTPLRDSFLEKIKQSFNYAENPGAIICGVEGLIIKLHGNCPPQSLITGILGAAQLVESRLIEKMKIHLLSLQIS